MDSAAAAAADLPASAAPTPSPASATPKQPQLPVGSSNSRFFVAPYTAGHRPTNKPYALELEVTRSGDKGKQQALWALAVKLGEHEVEKRSTIGKQVSRADMNLAPLPAVAPAAGYSEDRSIGSHIIHSRDANADMAQLSTVQLPGEQPPLMVLTTTAGRKVRPDKAPAKGAPVAIVREHQQRYLLLQCNAVYELSLPAGEQASTLHMRSWRNDRTPLLLHASAESAIAARLPVLLSPKAPKKSRASAASQVTTGIAAAARDNSDTAPASTAPSASSKSSSKRSIQKKQKQKRGVAGKRRRSASFVDSDGDAGDSDDSAGNFIVRSLARITNGHEAAAAVAVDADPRSAAVTPVPDAAAAAATVPVSGKRQRMPSTRAMEAMQLAQWSF